MNDNNINSFKSINLENQILKINSTIEEMSKEIKNKNENNEMNKILEEIKNNKEEIDTIKLLFVNCEKNLCDKFTQTWENLSNLRNEIDPLIKRNKMNIVEEEKREKEEEEKREKELEEKRKKEEEEKRKKEEEEKRKKEEEEKRKKKLEEKRKKVEEDIISEDRFNKIKNILEEDYTLSNVGWSDEEVMRKIESNLNDEIKNLFDTDEKEAINKIVEIIGIEILDLL